MYRGQGETEPTKENFLNVPSDRGLSVSLPRGCPKRSRPRIPTAWAWATTVPPLAANTVGASGGSGWKMLELGEALPQAHSAEQVLTTLKT